MNTQTQSNLKTLTKSLVVAGIISAVSLPVVAKKYNDYSDYNNSAYDYAKVVDVNPVIETYQVNNPVEKCWDERVPVRKARYSNRSHRTHDSKTPEIFGAIIGAAVGNQLGKKGGGKARDVATVAGAVLGGSVARDIKHNNRAKRDYHRGHHYEQTRYETVQRCEVRDSFRTEEQIVGYDVAYKYRGNVFHTQMDQHPGKKIKVKITVDPV